MTVYILEFCQGEYSDYTQELVGVYTTEENLGKALEMYKEKKGFKKRIETNYGEFRSYPIELDKDLI